MKKNIFFATVCVMTLWSCSDQTVILNSGGDLLKPETPVIKLGIGSGTHAILLDIKGSDNITEEEKADLYIDLNGNGKKDNGEEIRDGRHEYIYPENISSLSIYGKIGSIDATGYHLKDVSGDGLSYLKALNLFGTGISPKTMGSILSQLNGNNNVAKTLGIEYYKATADLRKTLESKGWKLIDADGQEQKIDGDLFLVRIKPKDASAEEMVTLAATMDENGDFWLDKNLNGKKDQGEELYGDNGDYEMTSPVTKDGYAYFAIHGPLTTFEEYNPKKSEDFEESEESEDPAESEPQKSTVAMESVEVYSVVSNGLITMTFSPRGDVKIVDLKGASNLSNLSLKGNPIEQLDIPMGMLSKLEISGHKLPKLDLSACEKLTVLLVSDSELEEISLPKKGNNLFRMTLKNNKLKKIDLSSYTGLKEVYLDNNTLTEIKLTKKGNEKLKNLTCTHNRLTSLDVSELLFLKDFKCGNNPLTSLKIPNTLLSIAFAGTDLTVANLNPDGDRKSFLSKVDLSGNDKLQSVTLTKCHSLLSIDLTKCPALDMSKLISGLPSREGGVQGKLFLNKGKATPELISKINAHGWTVFEK